MGRRARCRWVGFAPAIQRFKPHGIPMSELEEIVLTVDELEALRLADLEGLYHDQCAEEMNISRQTFGRIIESARRKVAKALIENKALTVEGGEYKLVKNKIFRCAECQHTWELPKCGSPNLHRAEEDRGWHGHCHGQRSRGRGMCFRQPADSTDQP